MVPGRNAEITLREITKESAGSVLQPEVSTDQKKLVASNAVSIAQAHFSEKAWFRAIYANDTLVGFVMLYVDEDKPEYEVWRFMVDKDHQGKGYGREAMLRVIEHVRGLPDAKELYLSYVPGEGNPAPFYRKLGFKETGKWNNDEKVMKLTL
jgi:diamine N-acetyltransferase